MQHLKTFMLASGMKINLDKCILILLGDWIDHPPQALQIVVVLGNQWKPRVTY